MFPVSPVVSPVAVMNVPLAIGIQERCVDVADFWSPDKLRKAQLANPRVGPVVR